MSGSLDSPERTKSGFLLQFISGLDGLQEKNQHKRIHLVSYRWIEPWILSLGNGFYLYHQWEEWINKIPVGKTKRCTSQKMVKLRKHQGKRMRETTEVPGGLKV